MDGNRLDIYFEKGKVNKAIVGGNAQSTYYYIKDDRVVSGRNESSGDTIQVSFKDGKVGSLKMIGGNTLASGRYFDLEKSTLKKERKVDSTVTKDGLEKPPSRERLSRRRDAKRKENQKGILKDSTSIKEEPQRQKKDE